jgi:cell division protein FtsZ
MPRSSGAGRRAHGVHRRRHGRRHRHRRGPVIAKAAREQGILTVGVVTKPFLFEGTRRMRSAEAGIEELQKHVDTLIVIPNQNLFLVANEKTTFKEAFQMADECCSRACAAITDLMVMPGLINLDFADVRSVMGEMGKAMMGTGEAEGDGRALEPPRRRSPTRCSTACR